MARVRVALRHAASKATEADSPTCSFDEIAIDLTRREVRRKGELVHLTPIEYNLITVLVQHVGLVMTQRQLLKVVWRPGHTGENHYLRIFIH